MIGEALRYKKEGWEDNRLKQKLPWVIRKGIIEIFTCDLKTGTSIQGCVWMWTHRKDLPHYTNPKNNGINKGLALRAAFLLCDWLVL